VGLPRRGPDGDVGVVAGDATHLQLEPALPSISLSEDILRNAEIISCPATALITVENMTSFSELLLLRVSSFDALVERTPALLGQVARLPSPAGYFNPALAQRVRHTSTAV